MSRLNIPLSTNQSTRPGLIKGRVLWIFGFWGMVILISWILANLWFTRDTLSSYAPDGTIVVVHLTPSRLVWTKLITDFDDLPLISERSLTISDLADLKPKEISIFSFEGASAIAIRTSEKNLKREILNSYGINIQKLGRNRWLLSNKPLPYATQGDTKWSFGSIWPGTVGSLRLEGFFGHITANKNGYSIDIPKTKKTGDYLPALPETTVSAISLQSSAELGLSDLFLRFNTLLAPLEVVDGEQISQKIKENGGIIILTKDGFLLESTLDSTILSQTLKTAAFFKNPEIKPMIMPDGSTVQEIFINQDNFEPALVWINGQEVMSVKTNNGQFLALDGAEADIITSNQSLLEEYLNKKSEKTKKQCGSKNILVFFKPKELNIGFQIKNPTLIETALVFNTISLSTNKMYLCY